MVTTPPPLHKHLIVTTRNLILRINPEFIEHQIQRFSYGKLVPSVCPGSAVDTCFGLGFGFLGFSSFAASTSSGIIIIP
jgi:hypothetical protein